jgi:hypothetical protein
VLFLREDAGGGKELVDGMVWGFYIRLSAPDKGMRDKAGLLVKMLCVDFIDDLNNRGSDGSIRCWFCAHCLDNKARGIDNAFSTLIVKE